MDEVTRRPIGYTRAGRPIFTVAGGDGSTDTEERQEQGAHEPPALEVEETSDRLFGGRGAGQEDHRPPLYAPPAGDDDEAARAAARPPLYRQPRIESSFRSLGQIVSDSQALRLWRARYPGGGPTRGNDWSEPTMVRVSLRQVAGYRALVTAADASAGSLVSPDRRPGVLEPGLVRPRRVLDLVTHIATTSDLIEFAAEVSRVAAAAPVAEASALTGVTGLKAEGGLVFEQRTAAVRTFAVWIAATRRIMTDSPALRGYIDEYLMSDVAIELEDQLISGSGTGENLLGILNHPNIQTAPPPGVGESLLNPIRRAIRLVQVNARTEPNGALINPVDVETLDVLRINLEANHYLVDPFTPGPRTVWGIPLVVTDAVPAGTALIGDFSKAIVFDREELNILVGTAGDDFLRNIVRVLAEARATLAVIRPSAFVAADLAA